MSFGSAADVVDDVAPGSARRHWLLAAGGLIGLVILGVFALQVSRPLTADVSWLITVAERMLAGQRLYVDIFELNPPMCALLYLPWVWLAQLLRIAPEGIVVAAILGLALGALAIADKILIGARLVEERASWWVIGTLAFVLLPGPNFAEREHFALLAVIPILATLAARADGQIPRLWQRIAAGIGAGFAMAIKPHFALAILLPAIYAALRQRSWRPIFGLENVVAGLVLVAFWVMVALVFPAFFTTMLPIAASIYAGDRVGLLLLVVQKLTWPFWGFVLVLLLLYRGQLRQPYLATTLFGAFGFFLAYLAQGKGFAYHLMPALALVVQTFLMAFATRNRGGGGWRRALPLLPAILLSILPIIATPANPDRRAIVDLLRPLGPGLRIANITPQLETTSPLQRQIGATLINSGPFLWMALGAIRIENTSKDPGRLAEARQIEQRERDMLRNDMLRTPPDIILAGADAFDWLGWAEKDPVIARLLTGYDVIARNGGDSDLVTILKRRDFVAGD